MERRAEPPAQLRALLDDLHESVRLFLNVARISNGEPRRTHFPLQSEGR
jgi:hypothetical protein